MTYREADVAAIVEAWRVRDRAALGELSARVGVELELAALGALVRGAGAAVRRRDVVATILDAATRSAGIGLYAWDGAWLCLAVRHRDAVVAVIARAASVGKAWPALKPWFGELERNRARCEAWVDAGVEGSVRFPCKPVEVPAVRAVGEDELIRQIIESPGDPAPRAVLADLWLERDHVRGKLVRLEAEIAALPRRDPGRSKRELVLSMLLAQHREALAGDVLEHAHDVAFAGGFVDGVTMSATAFRKAGARLFAAQPIRMLTLRPVSDGALALLAGSPIEVLRALRLDADLPLVLAPLAGARLDRLERLELKLAAVDDETTLMRLVAPRLRAVTIEARRVSAGTLRGLARSCGANLEELRVRGEPAGDLFDGDLALPRLRELELDGGPAVSDGVLARLVESAPQLEVLLCGRSDAQTFAAAAACERLREIEIPRDLAPALLEPLLALPRLDTLAIRGFATPAPHVQQALLALPARHPLRYVDCLGPDVEALRARFEYRARR